jgi:hypothetical protein
LADGKAWAFQARHLGHRGIREKIVIIDAQGALNLALKYTQKTPQDKPGFSPRTLLGASHDALVPRGLWSGRMPADIGARY